MTGDLLILFVVGWATAIATGLGAVPVFVLGSGVARYSAALTGFAAGLMGVAAIVGLLRPAFQEGSALTVVASLLVGIAFLAVTREVMRRRDAHAPARRHLGASGRRSILVVLVLFVHSIPEGLAIGTAFASEEAGLGLFVILAIALQNVPEGTATALPMQEAGYPPARQFWAAVLTSAPQPFAAVGAYVLVEQVSVLLPASFAFAAGAMLALIAVDLVPHAFTRGRRASAALGAAIGAALMLLLGALLGV
jgi:ZIP family zinc transporter